MNDIEHSKLYRWDGWWDGMGWMDLRVVGGIEHLTVLIMLVAFFAIAPIPVLCLEQSKKYIWHRPSRGWSNQTGLQKSLKPSNISLQKCFFVTGSWHKSSKPSNFSLPNFFFVTESRPHGINSITRATNLPNFPIKGSNKAPFSARVIWTQRPWRRKKCKFYQRHLFDKSISLVDKFSFLPVGKYVTEKEKFFPAK